MDAVIALFSKQDSPRLRWAAKVFFTCAMRVKVVHYFDKTAWEEAPGVKVNYCPKDLHEGFHISPHGLLWEKEISEQELFPSQWNDLPIICQRNLGSVPFDPLAATFYLASRYEEYLPFIPDAHGRFPAAESFAFQNDFLERPLINEWALALGKLMFGEDFDLSAHYSYRTTVDIDNLFAFKGKGALRTIGAFTRDITQLNFSTFKQRLTVLLGIRRDPFDTFRTQRNWNKKHHIPTTYFMLFAEFGPNDRNVSPYSTDAAVRLRDIADWAEVGIHPSYASSSDEKKIATEREDLQEVLRRPVNASRQHYLKLRTPYTQRTLVDLGITDEHSMGYAELAGFRASMATPFTFYDVEMDAELPLIQHPFAFMDTTYYMYGGLSAEQARKQLMKWPAIHRKVGGALISIWHNRTFGESEPQTEGWVSVYKDFIDAAKV